MKTTKDLYYAQDARRDDARWLWKEPWSTDYREMYELAKELETRLQQALHDIEAYRGALGYSVSGDPDGKLSDGTAPVCGLCEAKRLAIEKVLVGGNHVAQLLGRNHPSHKASNGEAFKYYASLRNTEDVLDLAISYEAWCCWKTIMELRDVFYPEIMEPDGGWKSTPDGGPA